MLKNTIKIALLSLVIAFMFYLTCYKPNIRYATTSELDAIYGIKKDGVIIARIQTYINDNPDCSVEDLRVIKGVDDMVIEQLERKWR